MRVINAPDSSGKPEAGEPMRWADLKRIAGGKKPKRKKLPALII